MTVFESRIDDRFKKHLYGLFRHPNIHRMLEIYIFVLMRK